MTVLDLQNQCCSLPHSAWETLSTVLALGNFDGVHRGHLALLEAARSLAERIGASPAVWTFSAHPYANTLKQLTTMQDKLTLFARAGIRYVCLTDFADVHTMSPTCFVHDVLWKTCRAQGAVCGFNYHFGAGGNGDALQLQTLFAEKKLPVTIVDPVLYEGEIISSTRIRRLLDVGNVIEAANCLGRNFSLCQQVVHGKELGRLIGTPTINQNIPPWLQLPCRGTYATTVEVNGVFYAGVTNIGIRPSIHEGDSHHPNAETHIIGYHGWLYDKKIRVFFRYRLRDEQDFASIDALKEQIARDISHSIADFSGQL